LGGAIQHGQLDRQRAIALLNQLSSQCPVEFVVRTPAAPVRDNHAPLRVFCLGEQAKKAVSVPLLQPNRIANHEARQNAFGPALFPFVVLGERIQRKQEEANKKPAEAGSLSRQKAPLTQDATAVCAAACRWPQTRRSRRSGQSTR